MRRDDDVFAEALEAPPEKRAAFLDQACAGNLELRARVDALLAGANEGENFLQQPLLDRGAVAPNEQPGDVIGRYALAEKLGEGGCGVVWRAEQREPVRREVALKVIKLGMDTREVIARFEAERQALAMMDHPNIARVFDGGATESGRPYFVMELVRGVPITKFCDEHALTLRQRLELFIAVCEAVQHAHQKGIIHRDLKPSNILVTRSESESESERGETLPPDAMPKVIDFGIAKATQGRLTDATLHTAVHQFIGTPVYMSSEQAAGGIDVDTRSDIYSLGVLLYELLTGETPLDRATLASSSSEEIREKIRTLDPVRPSARVRGLDVARASRPWSEKSFHHGQDAHATPRAGRPCHSELRGDLDWIVMRCLEKDRARRYESAAALAADLRRHLNDEPVSARPPNAGYMLRKFIQRHRLAVAAAAVVAMTLTLGAVVRTWQAIRATRAEEIARRGEQEQTRLRAIESAQRRRAETAERAAVRRAYAADMNLIQQALAGNNLSRARELLDRQRPKPGEADLRGWEWRYLWQQCRGDEPIELGRKPGNISALVPSPDGRWLAIASVPDGVRPGWLWVRDLHSHAEVEISIDNGVSKLAFSAGSALLAIALGGDQPRIRLWSAPSSQLVREWPLPAGRCLALRFSPDGTELLTAMSVRAKGGTALRWLRWRTADGAPLDVSGSVETKSAGAVSADVTPDLSRAAFIEDPRQVALVDLTTGTKLWTVPSENSQGFDACAISRDGQLVASVGGEGKTAILLWDGASGRKIGELRAHLSRVTCLTFCADGRTLVSGGLDQTIRLWDVASREAVRVLRGHDRPVSQLVLIAARRDTLVSAARSGVVFRWDLANAPARSTELALPGQFTNWRFADDSHSVIGIATSGEMTRRSGPDFGTVEKLMKVDPRLNVHFRWSAIQLEPPRLAAPMTDGRIQVWDWKRRTLCSELITGHPGAMPEAFVDRGRKLLVWTKEQAGDGALREWDVERAIELRSWPGLRRAGNPNAVDFGPFFSLSSDERQIWLLDAIGTLVRIERAANTYTVAQLEVQSPWGSLLSPDDRHLVVRSTFANQAKVWDARTLQPVATLPAFVGNGGGFAFSSDGRRLAMGGQGAEGLRLWDAESWETLLALPSPVFLGGRIAFSPDGNTIGTLSATGASSLRFWRAPSWVKIEAAEKEGRWR